MWGNSAKVEDLIGRTLKDIKRDGDDSLTFICDNGAVYKMLHYGDCCESVSIDDIAGDLSDLIGTPILAAEEATSDENPPGIKAPPYQDSFTWTFYKFATKKGYVDIRWYGQSNGYYSERVDFEMVEVGQ